MYRANFLYLDFKNPLIKECEIKRSLFIANCLRNFIPLPCRSWRLHQDFTSQQISLNLNAGNRRWCKEWFSMSLDDTLTLAFATSLLSRSELCKDKNKPTTYLVANRRNADDDDDDDVVENSFVFLFFVIRIMIRESWLLHAAKLKVVCMRTSHLASHLMTLKKILIDSSLPHDDPT